VLQLRWVEAQPVAELRDKPVQTRIRLAVPRVVAQPGRWAEEQRARQAAHRAVAVLKVAKAQPVRWVRQTAAAGKRAQPAHKGKPVVQAVLQAQWAKRALAPVAMDPDKLALQELPGRTLRAAVRQELQAVRTAAVTHPLKWAARRVRAAMVLKGPPVKLARLALTAQRATVAATAQLGAVNPLRLAVAMVTVARLTKVTAKAAGRMVLPEPTRATGRLVITVLR
jgi:hypothetical protein